MTFTPPNLGQAVHVATSHARMDDEQEFRYRPSQGLEFTCPKAMTYAGLGVEHKPYGGRAHLTFDAGHLWEWLMLGWEPDERLANFLGIPADTKIAGYFSHVMNLEVSRRGYEVYLPIGPGGTMKAGHIDGIVHTPDFTAVIDIKAINHFTYQAYKDSSRIPNDYLDQLTLYAHAMDMDYFVLFIMNKNTGAIQEGWYERKRYANGPAYCLVTHTATDEPDQELGGWRSAIFPLEVIAAHRARNEDVERHIQAGTLPERGFVFGHWKCANAYCLYPGHCYEGYEEETMGNKSKVPTPELADAFQRAAHSRRGKLDYEKDFKHQMALVQKLMIGTGQAEVEVPGFGSITRDMTMVTDANGQANPADKIEYKFNRGV